MPDRAGSPGGNDPRGVELPGGRRGGGPEDSNLVMAGVGGGGNDPLTAHAAPPPATAGGAPGAIGQTMNGPASPAHPDAPQGSAGGGGASGGPLPPAAGQPPPSTPSDSGGQSIKPGNATDGRPLAEHPDGETPVKKLDFAGSLRRIANINDRPAELNQNKKTQVELAHSREVVRARMAEIKAKGGNVTLAEASDLDLSDLTRTPVLAGLHEYGHHVEKQLAPADVAAVVEAARKTISASELAAQADNSDYYLDPEELWARAYEQFVAQSSGDTEALNELKSVRDHSVEHSRCWDKKTLSRLSRRLE